MKVLFIGGTGFISSAVSRMAIKLGFELYLLNRGLRGVVPPGSQAIIADIKQPGQLKSALQDVHFDVVVDWIAYTPQDIERDLEFFAAGWRSSSSSAPPPFIKNPPTITLSPNRRRSPIPFGTTQATRSPARSG